jgi:hypothetical protein
VRVVRIGPGCIRNGRARNGKVVGRECMGHATGVDRRGRALRSRIHRYRRVVVHAVPHSGSVGVSRDAGGLGQRRTRTMPGVGKSARFVALDLHCDLWNTQARSRVPHEVVGFLAGQSGGVALRIFDSARDSCYGQPLDHRAPHVVLGSILRAFAARVAYLVDAEVQLFFAVLHSRTWERDDR